MNKPTSRSTAARPVRRGPVRRGLAKTWLVAWLAVSAGLLGRSLWRGESPAAEVASRGAADAASSRSPALTQRDDFRPIERLRVGDRVVSDNPDVASPAKTAVDPSTWRLVTLYAEQTWPDGTLDTIHVRTLQPPEWLDLMHAEVGAEVPPPLDLVEMGLPDDLLTEVVKVEPCPPLAPPLPGDDPGRLVLTTVNHLNADVWELTAEPIRGPPGEELTVGEPQTIKPQTLEPTPLYPTGGHRFYSETRSEWVATNELEPGEVIRGRGGALRVTRAWPQPGVQRVYNLTVEGEHAYYVGEHAALAHNTCGKVFRQLNAGDRARLEAGKPLLPKGEGGTIAEQVLGDADTQFISASKSISGTDKFDSGFGLIEIDVAKARELGARFVDHTNVIQAAKRDLLPRQVQNAVNAEEVLFKGPIPFEAIRLINP